MKNFANIRFVSIVGALFMLLFSMPAAAVSTNVVKFNQGPIISAISGQQLTVSVVGENFTTGPDGAGFSLSWNPAVLAYVSSAIATPPWNALSVGSSVDDTNAASGSLDYVFLTMDSGNAGANFAVADFTFDVTGLLGASSALTLANDLYGIGFINGTDSLNVEYTQSVVQVVAPQAVPVPAAFWLFGASLTSLLGVLGGLKRRNAK